MRAQKSEMSYRRSAIEGASPLGLVIVLLDRLTADLQRAVAAVRKGDIEGRCRQFNHAFQILAQLESWLDMERPTEPAKLLASFYAQIRANMMEAGVKKSAPILEKQIAGIVSVRSAWQLLDAPPPSDGAPSQQAEASSMVVADAQQERVPFSLSA